MRGASKNEIEDSKTISLNDFFTKLLGKVGTKKRMINDARIKIVEKEMIEDTQAKSFSL